MNRISASIIADSKNEFGQRLTTFVLTFPRIILAEFNTHRMLSKNSASSRAIPFKKMLEKVKNEPFIPIRFQKDHSGMQGNEYFDDIANSECIGLWLDGRDYAVKSATNLSDYGITKQLANRLLEPFLYHTVIVTGSEWENFFALRFHPMAEIHIADLAEKMLIAYNESNPKNLKGGEWHIPFGDKFDLPRLHGMVDGKRDNIQSETGVRPDKKSFTEIIKIQIATARCARVSYDNFDGQDDYSNDVKLYEKLSTSGHWSPFEHCAKAMTEEDYNSYGKFEGWDSKYYENHNLGWCGNFQGFIQLRKTFTNENKTDSRVIHK